MASAKPKILFVHYSDLDMTGGERMTLRLIEGMSGSQYRPILLTQRYGPLAQAVRTGGIETIVLPLPSRLDRYDGGILRYSVLRMCATALDLLSYNIRFARIATREGISAVWCSNIRALLTVGVTARILNLPVIWNVWLARRFGRVTQWLYDICYLLPTHIVTEYYGQASGLFSPRATAMGGQKVSTVYTGLDPSAFVPPSPDQCSDIERASGTWHVVTCCRITPRKNVECLLEAIAMLNRRGKRVRATVIGKPFSECDKKYFDGLRRKVADDATSSLIEFAGWRKDVRAHLAAADLFVSTSLSEGLPGAVREAQAAGLPVVATDAGGTREAIQDRVSGLLVPCGDANALAIAIEKVVADPELCARFGAAGRKHAAEMFSMEAFIRGYASVFCRALR